MTIIEAVRQAFNSAFRESCRKLGVSTLPFWRLGIADDYHIHNPDELRESLAKALLDNSFGEEHVPAFLLLVQSQAAGHGYKLWEETLIPLLAGMGADRNVRQDALRRCFDGEQPFRAALRRWLERHHRAAEYTRKGLHFWFVRAVIGECALVWVSGEFTEQYLNEMFSEWSRAGEVRDFAERRFEHLLKTFRNQRGLGADEIGSIEVLKDCLVEAGLRLAAVARLIRGQIPPPEGWTVDSLLDRARNLLGISFSGLPKAIVKILRKRIEQGISSYSLDQLIGLFRRHPEAVLQLNGYTWSLRAGTSPPVTHGILRLGNGIARQVVLVDDLGRGPDEVLSALAAVGEGWHVSDGTRWRVSRTPFRVSHPSRLRSDARPVLGSGVSMGTPNAWVWTGSADAVDPSKAGPKYAAELSGSPSRFRLVAWPTLDRELHPTFYVLRFRLSGGENRRTIIRSEAADGREEDLWSDISTDGWIDLRRRAPATAGRRTKFLLQQPTDGASLFLEEVSLKWPCPALIVAGRNLVPGKHLLPRDGRIYLVTTEIPEVTNGRLQELTCSHPSIGQARMYEVSPDADRELSVAAEGECWSLDPRHRPLVRLRLSSSSVEGPDASRYGFSDPGIRVFFQTPPQICLHVTFSTNEEQLSIDGLFDRLGALELSVGLANEPFPSIRIACASLRSKFTANKSENGITLQLPFESFAPQGLIEPGFDVRRVALDGWEESDESAFSTMGVLGHGERFVVLPYSREILLARSPGSPGGIRLDDPSDLHDPLELREPFSGENPAEGQAMCEGVPLTVQFPFSTMTLETRSDIALTGAWFWEQQWNLETLLILLADTSRDCARVVLPGEPTAMVLVEVTDTVGNESCLITAPLSGPVLGDVSLRSLLPAKLLEDPSFQRPWLTSPFSLVRIELRGKEVGRFALDLRPSVTGFRLIIQRDPTPAGGTTIELEIEVIPGFVAGQAIEVMAVHLSSACADQSGPSIPVRFGTESIEREVVACSLDLKEPGEYRLELRRKGDRTPLRTLEVTARAPSIPLGHITLNAFLESWPSSEPVLANMVLLYRFLRTLPEPWCEFSLYTAIDRSRGALHNRRTLLYRLVDTLFGFLDDPPRNVMRVELVQPECVPMEILAEVGTVVLQLQFYTDEPLRVGLPKWEAVLTEACKDFDRSEEERAWLGILALAAGNLTGIARPMTSVLKRYTSAVVRPYFPCRDDFLNFLQGQTVPELISKGTK